MRSSVSEARSDVLVANMALEAAKSASKPVIFILLIIIIVLSLFAFLVSSDVTH